MGLALHLAAARVARGLALAHVRGHLRHLHAGLHGGHAHRLRHAGLHAHLRSRRHHLWGVAAQSAAAKLFGATAALQVDHFISLRHRRRIGCLQSVNASVRFGRSRRLGCRAVRLYRVFWSLAAAPNRPNLAVHAVRILHHVAGAGRAAVVLAGAATLLHAAGHAAEELLGLLVVARRHEGRKDATQSADHAAVILAGAGGGLHHLLDELLVHRHVAVRLNLAALLPCVRSSFLGPHRAADSLGLFPVFFGDLFGSRHLRRVGAKPRVGSFAAFSVTSLAALLVGGSGRAGAEVQHLLVHDAHSGIRSAAVSVLLGLAACGLGRRVLLLLLSDLLLGRRAGLAVVALGGSVDNLAAFLARLAAALAVLGQVAQVLALLLVEGGGVGRALGVSQARLDASLFARQRALGDHDGHVLACLDEALNRHRAADLFALALGRAALLHGGVAGQCRADALLDGVSRHAADGLLGATAALQAALVLDALALAVRFLLVAVHLGDGDGLGLALLVLDEASTGLAATATGVLDALRARDLATLLELGLGDRAHARLGRRVQGLRRRPVRAVNLLIDLARQALGLRPHGLAAFFCHFVHCLLLAR